MVSGDGLNQLAQAVFAAAAQQSESLCIQASTLECGAHLLDFGVHARGGLEAGLRLAQICLAGRAHVQVTGGDRSVWRGPWVRVTTDHPVQACLLGQYAGWPVKGEKFFAMGSGPMRVRRGKEEVLKSLQASDSLEVAVGSLECDQLPSSAVAEDMAAQCCVPPSSLYLAVAPTRSLAGCVQVVARSVETSLHKLYELGFPLESVKNAFGIAPLPPPTPDFALGIGRTNDAILYGGHVTLWVDADDDQITAVGPQIPSSDSRDFGAPFAEVFKRYEYDFYRVDPGLFSPAEIVIHNLRTGCSWHYGELREDLVASSFALEQT